MAVKSPIYKYQPLWGAWKADEVISQESGGGIYRVYKEEWGRKYFSAVKLISIAIGETDMKEAEAVGIAADLMPEYFKSYVDVIINEIEAMYRLRGSSNITAYEDHAIYARKGGAGWDILIRMEYLQPLPAYMAEHVMSRGRVIKLGTDVCKALEACRQEGITHGDIRDENVFISDSGDFKLGNFSLRGKFASTAELGLHQKNTLFMAPEIYRERGYDTASDIYSLGMLMYKLLNKGRPPFLPLPPAQISISDTENSIQSRINGKELPLPADADESLGKLVLKACSHSPKDRYKSPEEFRQKLERLSKLEGKIDRAGEYIAAAKDTSETIQIKEEGTSQQEKHTGKSLPKSVVALTERKYFSVTVAVVIMLITVIWISLVMSDTADTAKTKPEPPPKVYQVRPTPAAAIHAGPAPTEGVKEALPAKTGEDYYADGLGYMQKKQYGLAIKAFEHARQMGYSKMKSDSRISQAKRRLDAQKLYDESMEYYNKKDFDNAVKSFNRLSEIDSSYKELPQYRDAFFQSASGHNLSGVKFYNEGKFQAAINEFDFALNRLAEMETRLGKYDPALYKTWSELYKNNKSSAAEKMDMIKENLSLAEACNRSGVKLYNENDIAKAVQEFQKAVKYMEELKTALPEKAFDNYEGLMQLYSNNFERAKKYCK